MSAIRYCGALRIRVTYVDDAAWSKGEPAYYRCHISPTGNNAPAGVTVRVTPPTFETHARDSSDAFDAAAHAALSFALDEGWPVDSYAREDGSGWQITRKWIGCRA